VKAFLVFVAVLLATPAMAADPQDSPYGGLPSSLVPQPLLLEVRFGAYVHDPLSPERGSADLNGEVLLAPWTFDPHGWSFLVPRVHIGVTGNLGGKTSHADLGLTWTYVVTQSIFTEATFGGAVHDGSTGSASGPGHNALGCSPLFRESASLGYRINTTWSVMAIIEHMSNAGLCAQNRGLTNAGIRVGYSF
jgi:lipid A 3-O-deacylase